MSNLLPVIPENIPKILRDRSQWLCWRLEKRSGKWSKVPINAITGRYGKSNDPKTWTDFSTAFEKYKTGNFHGVGFAFAEGDNLCGIDIDHVLDPASGGIVKEWAVEIVERFKGTYIERSPSGTGLRIFCYGKPVRCGKGGPENSIEIYDYTSPRYLTVTGQLYTHVTTNH